MSGRLATEVSRKRKAPSGRPAGAGHTKKGKWRRLEHKEVDDTASADVTKSIVERADAGDKLFSIVAEGGRKSKSRAAVTLDLEDAFIETSGEGLSRSLKKQIKKISTGEVLNASEHQNKALDRFVKTKTARLSSAKAAAERRNAEATVYDVWGGEPPSLAPKMKAFKRKVVKVFAPPTVPAVKLPSDADSCNPEPEALTGLVLGAAAVETEKDRRHENLEKWQQPLTTALLDVLPANVVEGLTSLEKQRVFHKIASKHAQGLSDLTHIVEQETAAGEAADDAEDQSEEDEDEVNSQPEEGKRKQPRKKTIADRNRYERHVAKLQEAQKEKEEERFLRQFDKVTAATKHLNRRERLLEARRLYKQSLKEAAQAAHKRGEAVKFKMGRTKFQEAPAELILPSELEQSGGCLRRLKLGAVSGVAVRERSTSIMRRGLVQLPTAEVKPAGINKISASMARRKLAKNYKIRRIA